MLFLLLTALQGGYPLPAGAFTERIQTRVISSSGLGNTERNLTRTARYDVAARGDTLVVSAAQMDLRQTVDGDSATVPTDGFVGGRYRLLLRANGTASVLARPFVPDQLTDVSDLGGAMDDFFPHAPPVLAAGKSAAAAGWTWQRLADSSGRQRFQWRRHQAVDTVRTVADTLPMTVQQDIRESGSMVWDALRGPLTWKRTIMTTSTSRLRGQVVRATISQEIVVRAGGSE